MFEYYLIESKWPESEPILFLALKSKCFSNERIIAASNDFEAIESVTRLMKVETKCRL